MNYDSEADVISGSALNYKNFSCTMSISPVVIRLTVKESTLATKKHKRILYATAFFLCFFVAQLLKKE